MRLLHALPVAAALLASSISFAHAQDHAGMAMAKPKAAPSTTLTLTGIGGATKTFTPADFKALAHTTVSVSNAHNGKTEKYSGVPVRALLALVDPPTDDAAAPKVSQNLTLVVAHATDGFRVALSLCEVDPACRTGEAIVADSMDGTSLAADGAFKLVLTEDRKPGRWARNLDSLSVKSAAGL